MTTDDAPRPLTLEQAARRALYAALDELGGHADVAGQQELAQLLTNRLRTLAAVRSAGGQDAGRGGGGPAHSGQRDGGRHQG